MKKIAVIGSGIYGCYIIRKMQCDGFLNNNKVFVFEAGDSNIKNQKEIGLNIFSKNYNGASKGRFFGLGGTSNKWGGQILFFDKYDFKVGEEDWNDIVSTNIRYTDKVKKFIGLRKSNKNSKRLIYGDWLYPFNRKFYKKINHSNLYIKTNHIAIEIIKVSNKYTVIFKKQDAYEGFDQVFIVAGALETARLINNSKNNLTSLKGLKNDFQISDHLSFKSHDIYNSDFNFNKVDLNPRISISGLCTPRIRIKTKNMYGYIHPIFNENVDLFIWIKKFIFKIDNTKNINYFLIFKDFILFIFYFLQGKLYVSKSKNSIQIDLEKSTRFGVINFQKNNSKIHWEVTNEELLKFKRIQKIITFFLKENKIDHKELELSGFNKVVDTYHPTTIFTNLNILEKNYKIKNEDIFMFNTGILHHSGSINPTAAVFPLIERHFSNV